MRAGRVTPRSARVDRARRIADAHVHGCAVQREAGRHARDGGAPVGRQPRLECRAGEAHLDERHAREPVGDARPAARAPTKSARMSPIDGRARIHPQRTLRRRSRCPPRRARPRAAGASPPSTVIVSTPPSGWTDAPSSSTSEKSAPFASLTVRPTVWGPPLQRRHRRTVTSGGSSSTERAAHAGRAAAMPAPESGRIARHTRSAPWTGGRGIAASLTPGRPPASAVRRGPGRVQPRAWSRRRGTRLRCRYAPPRPPSAGHVMCAAVARGEQAERRRAARRLRAAGRRPSWNRCARRRRAMAGGVALDDVQLVGAVGGQSATPGIAAVSAHRRSVSWCTSRARGAETRSSS